MPRGVVGCGNILTSILIWQENELTRGCMSEIWE